jgi:hypothetical protein
MGQKSTLVTIFEYQRNKEVADRMLSMFAEEKLAGKSLN